MSEITNTNTLTIGADTAPEASKEVKPPTRRTLRRRGQLITRTLPLRVREARISKTQALIPLSNLIERAAWLQELITRPAQAELRERWSEDELLKLLEPGLSSYAFKAYEQAYGRWSNAQPEDESDEDKAEVAYYDSRAKWIIEETVGRTLRSTHYQREITNLLLAGKPEEVLDPITRRNLQRRVCKFKQEHSREPIDFFELNPEPPTLANAVITLSCVDKQFARVSTNPEKTLMTLDLKLPVVKTPKAKRDWEWVTLLLPIPEHASTLLLANPENSLRLPSLRVRSNQSSGNNGNQDALLFDVPLETIAEPVNLERLKQPARRVLAFDWGERRLLTGAVLEIQENGDILEVAGPFTCDTRLAQSRMMCQRAHARKLNDKQKRIRAYYETETGKTESNLPDTVREKVSILETECSRNWTAHRQLQKQTGHHAAHWAVSLALEYDCDTIVLENLKSLEPRLKGLKQLRDRLNHQTRGQLTQYLSEKAQREGIKIMSVYARGTSSQCPRCGSEHSHVKASDTPRKRGRGWALCECGSNLDRDHAAALRIGSRALTDKTGKKPTKPVQRRVRGQCKKKASQRVLSSQSSSSSSLIREPSHSKRVFSIIDYTGSHDKLHAQGRALALSSPTQSLSQSSNSRECLNGARNRVTVASITEQESLVITTHSIPQYSKSSEPWSGYHLMIINHKPRKT